MGWGDYWVLFGLLALGKETFFGVEGASKGHSKVGLG
jgi:hypothetical protein